MVTCRNLDEMDLEENTGASEEKEGEEISQEKEPNVDIIKMWTYY